MVYAGPNDAGPETGHLDIVEDGAHTVMIAGGFDGSARQGGALCSTDGGLDLSGVVFAPATIST
jgi:hypothetical protein